MKRVLMLIVVLFAGVHISAQWKTVPYLDSLDIRAVYFEKSAIYAGTDSLVYTSYDLGETWTVSALIPGRLIPFSDITGFNNVLYAASYGFGVFRSLDKGKTWDAFSSGLDYYSQYVVSFLLSGDSLFIGTDGGGIYYMNPAKGNIWHSYNEGLPSNIARSVTAMIEANNKLIIGAGASGFFYTREKNSMLWIASRLDSIKRPNILSLSAFNDTVIAGTPRGIYRSTDNGITWDSVGITALPLDATHLRKSGTRIYAGFDRHYDHFIWYSDDKGAKWNSLDHQFTSLNNLYLHDNKIWAATNNGLRYFIPEVTKVAGDVTIKKFSLKQNYPNPFNPTTYITYSVPEKTFIDLSVFDILGRKVAVLASKEVLPGEYRETFDGSSLPSGVYIYTLQAGRFTNFRKLVILK